MLIAEAGAIAGGRVRGVAQQDRLEHRRQGGQDHRVAADLQPAERKTHGRTLCARIANCLLLKTPS
jgi:hypothetical protein